MVHSLRRPLFMSVAIVLLFTIFWALSRSFNLTQHGFYGVISPAQREQIVCSDTLQTPLHHEVLVVFPRRRRNIVVASVFAYHFDVYLALVWTLERVLGDEDVGATSGKVRVFAQPFHLGFPAIVERLGLYHGELSNPDALVPAILSSSHGSPIDMVILGTCEIDLPRWHDELLIAWDARNDAEKFQVVCIVHNVKDTSWQSHIPEWSRRGAFRVLTIADHVAKAFRYAFNEYADSSDPLLYTAGYEHIPVNVHVPVLDIQTLPEKASNRTLSLAAIQGSFSYQRRDYEGFFNDLISSLHDDPQAWGYLPLDEGTSFIPDPHSRDPPFRLLLVGSGAIEVPVELAYLATVRSNLDYEEFYALIASVDILVPAFAQYGYYEDQASSTVALAAELKVPLLVTQRMRQTYGYINDDRAVITRPAAMREVYAIKALRTGNASSFLDSDPAKSGFRISMSAPLTAAVEEMVRSGWIRDQNLAARFNEDLWEKNRIVVDQMLRDL